MHARKPPAQFLLDLGIGPGATPATNLLADCSADLLLIYLNFKTNLRQNMHVNAPFAERITLERTVVTFIYTCNKLPMVAQKKDMETCYEYLPSGNGGTSSPW